MGKGSCGGEEGGEEYLNQESSFKSIYLDKGLWNNSEKIKNFHMRFTNKTEERYAMQTDKKIGHHLKELEIALQRHARFLGKLLDDPNKIEDEHYWELAIHLRTLLCDRSRPLLLWYAEIKGIPLPIMGAKALSKNSDFPQPLLELYFLPVGWDVMNSGNVVAIQEYLNYPIGTVPVGDNNGKEKVGKHFSPKEIIELVANKEGVAHIAFDKPPILKALKQITYYSKDRSDVGFLIQREIYALAKWTRIAIAWVLCFSGLEDDRDKTITQLKGVVEQTPESLLRIFHYKPLRDGGVKLAFFEGSHFIKCEALCGNVGRKFCWHSMIKIIDQIGIGDKTIYALGSVSSPNSKFTISFDKNSGDLSSSILLESGQIVSVTVEKFRKTDYFDKFIALSVCVTLGLKQTKISLFINGEKINATEEQNITVASFCAEKSVIGGTLNEQKSASFFLSEVFLSKGDLDEKNIRGIAKYLWSEWDRWAEDVQRLKRNNEHK